MCFSGQIFQRDRLRSKASSFTLFCGTLLVAFILSGCGGTSDTSQNEVIDKIIDEVVDIPTIEENINFADESYTLLPLSGYESSGLQVYWPVNNDISAAQQASLQSLIPKLNQLFTGQHFAFSQLLPSSAPSLYKKIIFSPASPAVDDVGELSFVFADDNAIIVILDIDSVLDNANLNTLLIELTNIIYQSERRKYQDESSILDRLVSRGLVLHFLQQNLTVNEFSIIVDITSSELSAALAQVKSGQGDVGAIDDWFTKERLSEQTTANAIGYYLAAQHFSFYSGSDAANSFAVNSELFSPWLAKANNADKKSEQYVRTGNVPNQIAIEELARQANLYQGSYFIEGLHHEKLIALSFDDGPSQYTTQMLDVLEQAQVPASFFWQGQNLADYRAVIERSITAGHTVANHSWNHANGMRYNGDELWQQQVSPTNDEFQQLFNITPRFYRPPYGEITDKQIEYLASKGMKVLLWSVDSRDWNPALNSITNIESALINNQHEEVITLMHDAGGNRQNTVDSLPAIIEHYKAQGYRFVNLETLLGISDKH
jgi:peptidoglycan/xylan/chitin deacetylase (PgdA/CDA1 family)